jgi:pilus assembly protein TadC
MADTTTLDRFVSWTLDHNGDIYGDEQERLRWYEGIAVASSVQWIVVPWTMAVMSWICSREVARYLVVLAIVFYVPTFLTTVYVSRKRVNLAPPHRNAKVVTLGVVSGLPSVVMVVGLVRALDEGLDPDGIVGGVIGGAIGVVIAILAVREIARRRVIREANAVDE